jgi:hypothetical protein
MTWYNMALGKAIEAISEKEKAAREQDERARTKEAECKKTAEFECAANTAEHERKNRGGTQTTH